MKKCNALKRKGEYLMNIKDFVMSSYVELVDEEKKDLVDIAFDEMISGQYEEAAGRFEKLYTQDPNDYMSYFFRAYCKSHCGKRGDVYVASQKLTSAFNMAYQKAIVSSKYLDTEVYLMLSMYKEAMDNLAYNAVEEVHINSQGKTYKTNPTKLKIYSECEEVLVTLMRDSVNVLKKLPTVKAYITSYLQKLVDTNLNHNINLGRKQGEVLVLYAPEFASELEEKIKKAEAKKKRTRIIIAVAIGAFILIAVLINLVG